MLKFLIYFYFIIACEAISSKAGLGSVNLEIKSSLTSSKFNTLHSKSPKTPEEFFYVVAAPNEIQAHGNYTVLVTLKDSASPVLFNLSIVHNEVLLLQPKLVTLKPGTSQLVSFSTKSIPPGSDYSNDLKMTVSASSPTIGTYERYPVYLTRKATSRKKLLIECSKQHYSVGDIIKYRVMLVDPTNPLLVHKLPTRYKIEILGSSNFVLDSQEVNLNNSTTRLVYTGSSPANLEYQSLRVSFSTADLQDKPAFWVDKPKSNHFRVKLEWQRYLAISETRFEMNVSFFTVQESVPVDGTCKLEVRPHKTSGDFVKGVNWVKRVKMSSKQPLSKVEFDIGTDLQSLERNWNGEINCDISVVCIHSSSGIKIRYHSDNLNFVENTHKVRLLYATILPETSENLTPITIELEISRAGGRALLEEDLNETLNVNVDFTKGISSNHAEKLQFNFRPIPSNGIIRLDFSVLNATSMITKTLTVQTEFKERVNKLEVKKWNRTPDFQISLMDLHSSVYSGNVIKFRLCSSNLLGDFMEISTFLHSSSGFISSGVQTITMNKGKDGILEIVIPEHISGPQILFLTVYGRYSYWNKTNTGDVPVVKSFTSFEVNIPKPVLHLQHILQLKGTNQIVLGIDEGPNNIEHVSIIMEKVKETQSNQKPILTCQKTKAEEFASAHLPWQNPIRLNSNGNMRSRFRKSRSKFNGHFFEFSTFIEKNGTTIMSLSLDSKIYSGDHLIKATVFSNNPPLVTYTNAILVNLPTPKISLHIPYVPSTLAVEDTVEITAWIRNNSPNEITEDVYFEYNNEETATVYGNFSRSVTIGPNSFETLSLMVPPESAGKLILKLQSPSCQSVTRSIQVIPEGKLIRNVQIPLPFPNTNLHHIITTSILTPTNITQGVEFTVDKSVNASSGVLQLSIDLSRNFSQNILISLPSNYVFLEEDLEKETNRVIKIAQGQLDYTNLVTRFLLTGKGNQLNLFVPEEGLRITNIFSAVAYELYKVPNSSSVEDKSSKRTLYIESQSATNPKQKSSAFISF